MTQPTARDEPEGKTLMRSGTAARLAGLSPSTLRIWEHRYGVVAPPKSTSGQRNYSMKDIERLRLIKRLTLAGHAIGTVAHLDVDALALLSSGNQVRSAAAQRVLVVGHAAALKLAGRLRPAPALVFDDLAHAEREVGRAGAADVLVIHVASLHTSMTEQVIALRNNLPAPNVILVYSFGAEAPAEALRATGVTVRREPVDGKELARLVLASRPVEAALAGSIQTQPRRYSDAELITLTEMPSMVACECPRHLAEIVALLVSFELYSTECAARNQNDVALHRHLHEVTSAARTMLEQALARVVIEEGLVV
ncbi:MAG: MerR family transcriptional regulator [Rhodoferax sp.]|nr:MerR family transcriptional regulator [Rhodoferax sp.]